MRIFTKTFRGDLPWIDLALKSVSVFCKEPVEWVIAIEQEAESDLVNILGSLRLWNSNHQLRVRIEPVERHWPEALSMQGYMGQQWVKMNAHKAMSGLFWNWDSDVLAQRPFTQANFIGASGRPVYWFSHFNHLIGTGGADTPAHVQRRAVMQQIFHTEDISFEWMRCMPIALYADVLEQGSRRREWSESREKLVRMDRAFSEFNVIGQFSHWFFPDAYEWKNAEASGPTFGGGYVEGGAGSGALDGVSIITQCWSHGGVPENIKNYINSLMTGK